MRLGLEKIKQDQDQSDFQARKLEEALNTLQLMRTMILLLVMRRVQITALETQLPG